MTLKKREQARLNTLFDNIVGIYGRIPVLIYKVKDNRISFSVFTKKIGNVRGNLNKLNSMGLISEETTEDALEKLNKIHDKTSTGAYRKALEVAEDFITLIDDELKINFADMIRKQEYIEYPPTIPLLRVAEDGGLYVYTEGIGWKKPDVSTLKEEDVKEHIIDYYGEDFYFEELEDARGD